MTTSLPSVCCIVNPASAGGQTALWLPEIRLLLRTHFGRNAGMYVTSQRGEASQLAERAVCAGVHRLITVGGDGTIQEVANGMLAAALHPLTTLAIVSSGTGQGLAQSAGLPRSLAEQFSIAAYGSIHLMDVGRIEYRTPSGTDAARFFVNECQAGIGASVVGDVESRPKRFGGAWTFGLAAFRHAFLQPNSSTRIFLDGVESPVHSILGLVVGNGAFTGGGMNLARGARIDDGWLDLLIMRSQSVPRRIANLPRIYSGRHVDRSDFEIYRFRHLHVESDEFVEAEADGEYLGSLPWTVNVVPHALKIVLPDGGYHAPAQ